MIVSRSATLASGNPQLTAMVRTDDLAAGLHAYGTGIPVETEILSIDSPTALTLTRNATVTGAQTIQFTAQAVGAWHEMNCALRDAQAEIHERGDYVQIVIRSEAQTTRDAYNSIKKEPPHTTEYDFWTYPVEFQPSQYKLEKAGLREEADVTIYTAMKDWMDYGLNFNDIDKIRTSVHLQGDNYEVREIGRASHFGDTFLYITLGLFKK